MEIAAQFRGPGLAGRTLRLVVWICAAVLAYVAAFVLTLWLAGQIEGTLPGGGAGTPVHGFVLAAHIVGWGLLSGGLTAAAAAALYGQETRPYSQAVPLWAAGIVLAAAIEFALHEWARARFGVFSPEYVQGAAWLPAALLALTVAACATLIAPQYARPWLKLIVGLLVLWLVTILASYLPGALDGVSTEGAPLAVVTVAATVFTGFVAFRALRAR